MIFWWLPWFLGALGISVLVAFIGLLLSHRKKYYLSDPYKRMYEQLVAYAEECAEQLYQQKK